MNEIEAKALVSSWALALSMQLHSRAGEVEGAYRTYPMKEACAAYAARLREVSELLKKPLFPAVSRCAAVEGLTKSGKEA